MFPVAVHPQIRMNPSPRLLRSSDPPPPFPRPSSLWRWPRQIPATCVEGRVVNTAPGEATPS